MDFRNMLNRKYRLVLQSNSQAAHKQLEQEVVVFMIGDMTERGGVKLAKNLEIDIHALHQHRYAVT
jgi:hypothetical protein